MRNPVHMSARGLQDVKFCGDGPTTVPEANPTTTDQSFVKEEI